MEECFIISDLIHAVYYQDEKNWTPDIQKAYFFRHKETVEQFLSEADSESILRIVAVWIKIPK